jgi:hypothetical protein
MVYLCLFHGKSSKKMNDLGGFPHGPERSIFFLLARNENSSVETADIIQQRGFCQPLNRGSKPKHGMFVANRTKTMSSSL